VSQHEDAADAERREWFDRQVDVHAVAVRVKCESNLQGSQFRFQGWKQALSSYGSTEFDLYSPTTLGVIRLRTPSQYPGSPNPAGAATALCFSLSDESGRRYGGVTWPLRVFDGAGFLTAGVFDGAGYGVDART
jgi:hypothetical protein